VLPRSQSRKSGPWRNDNAPYLRGIMDIPLARGVTCANIMKGTQIGLSEAMRNVLGCLAASEPDPTGLCLPDRIKGRKIMRARVMPLLRKCLPELIPPERRAVQLENIELLNGWQIMLMWSGSASSMASDPMRFAFCDEIEKYKAWAGREADPVGLVAERLTTYEDLARQWNWSTPTTRFGKMYELWEASTVHLYFVVPCPACGEFQRLVFSQLKWDHFNNPQDRKLQAKLIAEQGAAWSECAKCGEQIREDRKPHMVRHGRWATDPRAHPGEPDIPDAEAVQVWPPGTSIGFQISALYCLWRSWPRIAAAFVRAKGNLPAMFSFRTNVLGEPAEEQVTRSAAGLFAAKTARATLAEGIVPAWAAKVLCTIDTQADHFYVVLRAWGSDMTSQRIWHGKVETFDELDSIITARYRVENDAFAPMAVELVLIDSGGTRLAGESASRTMQVYQWCLPRRLRVRPIKGANRPKPGLFIWTGRGWLDEGRKEKLPLRIWLLDTHHFQDELEYLIGRGAKVGDADPKEPEVWRLNQRVDGEYDAQMSNLRKVLVRRGAATGEEWVPISAGARIDYRDCEGYQVAAAYMARVHLLPPAAELTKARERAAQPPPPPKPAKNWVGKHGGWMKGR
jgi:phage terminase large subunit GpA-like protein